MASEVRTTFANTVIRCTLTFVHQTGCTVSTQVAAHRIAPIVDRGRVYHHGPRGRQRDRAPAAACAGSRRARLARPHSAIVQRRTTGQLLRRKLCVNTPNNVGIPPLSVGSAGSGCWVPTAIAIGLACSCVAHQLHVEGAPGDEHRRGCVGGTGRDDALRGSDALQHHIAGAQHSQSPAHEAW